MDTRDIRDLYIKSVPYMFSCDYRQRMVAEYNQLQYRIIHLDNYINGRYERKDDNETMIMKEQLLAMCEYRDALRLRILNSGINIAFRGEIIE